VAMCAMEYSRGGGVADNGLRLRDALALSLSMLDSEHMFSATMSSPWSVAKFAKSQQDCAQVWKLFKESAVFSFAFAGLVGWILSEDNYDPLLWALGGTAFFVGWMFYDYNRALNGTL